MKYLTIIILFTLIPYMTLAQNEVIIIPKNIDAQKVRSLLNESNIMSNKPILNDSIPLRKITSKEIPFLQMQKEEKEALDRRFSHFRFGVISGIGLRIAPISSKLIGDLAKRKKNLRSGTFYGIDGGYFFNENVGFGIKYSLFKSSNVIDNFSGSLPNANDFEGRITDDVNIHYVGPSLLLRSITRNKKIQTNCDLSLGYTGYRNSNKLNDKLNTITGNNFSFSSTIGTDFMFNKGMAIGLNFSIIAASIKNINVNGTNYTLNNEEAENISRLTFGLVFRFYK